MHTFGSYDGDEFGSILQGHPIVLEKATAMRFCEASSSFLGSI